MKESMPMENQVYAKWIRVLPSPDNPNEIYLILEKDSPMSKRTMEFLEEQFKGKDVIITIDKLIRERKKRRGRQKRE